MVGVGFLDPGELDFLAAGEVLGVLICPELSGQRICG